jgi:hypothetical protein
MHTRPKIADPSKEKSAERADSKAHREVTGKRDERKRVVTAGIE